jgi:pimeloyl-ACP methyl ester carboxylesterase
MPIVDIDGIATRYEVIGSGPPLLMFSPGGFDATIEKWSTLGIYGRIRIMEHLPKAHTCIALDRRECGQSGGRVERVTWAHFAEQGKGLLDHLKIERAHLMGGCMGCPPVTVFAAAWPERVAGMVLYWPVGGARYRLKGHARFAQHLAFVEANGLDAVVTLAKESGKSFGQDPRGGPWAAVIRNDDAFARAYAAQDAKRYQVIVAGMARTLLDRDTAPGAEPEDLMRLDIPALVVPGADDSHATSAARYLAECLPKAEYWDVMPEGQTEATAPGRVLEFLEEHS